MGDALAQVRAVREQIGARGEGEFGLAVRNAGISLYAHTDEQLEAAPGLLDLDALRIQHHGVEGRRRSIALERSVGGDVGRLAAALLDLELALHTVPAGEASRDARLLDVEGRGDHRVELGVLRELAYEDTRCVVVPAPRAVRPGSNLTDAAQPEAPRIGVGDRLERLAVVREIDLELLADEGAHAVELRGHDRRDVQGQDQQRLGRVPRQHGSPRGRCLCAAEQLGEGEPCDERSAEVRHGDARC